MGQADWKHVCHSAFLQANQETLGWWDFCLSSMEPASKISCVEAAGPTREQGCLSSLQTDIKILLTTSLSRGFNRDLNLKCDTRHRLTWSGPTEPNPLFCSNKVCHIMEEILMGFTTSLFQARCWIDLNCEWTFLPPEWSRGEALAGLPPESRSYWQDSFQVHRGVVQENSDSWAWQVCSRGSFCAQLHTVQRVTTQRFPHLLYWVPQWTFEPPILENNCKDSGHQSWGGSEEWWRESSRAWFDSWLLCSTWDLDQITLYKFSFLIYSKEMVIVSFLWNCCKGYKG